MKRILLIGQHNNGVFYHRLYVPYNALSRQGFDVQMTRAVNTITLDECKQFDIAVFNRNIDPDTFDPSPIFAKFRAAGCKIIMDIDDLWDIAPGHPMYSYARKTNFAGCCMDQLKYADHITTTHAHLKSQIVKLGIDKKKVTICRNAIDPSQDQYAQTFTKTDRLMWQGSSTHAMDLELLKDIEHPINLCGYSYIPEWFEMCEKVQQPIIKDALDVVRYMNHYNDTGISLIPLKDNHFNRNKSNLKMIEAGWANKPVICSNIHPYNTLADNMINCITAKTPQEFKSRTNMLLANQNLQDDISGKLHEQIKTHYLIDKVNERRIELCC